LARRRAKTPADEMATREGDRPSTCTTSANLTKRKHLSPSPPFVGTPPANTVSRPSSAATSFNSPSFDPPQPTKKSKSSRSASLLVTTNNVASPGGSTTLLNTAASSSRVDSKTSMMISVLSRATTLGLEKKRKDKSRKVIVSLEKGMYVAASMNGSYGALLVQSLSLSG
jgi:hypothetical protein